MDIQLQGLIEKIQNDGVKNAEEKSAAIVAEGQLKAAKIIENAEKKASSIISDAQHNASRKEVSGIEALKQAKRDVLISLDQEVRNHLDEALKREMDEAMKGKGLIEAVTTILSRWEASDAFELQVSEDEKKSIESAASKSFSEKIKNGLTVVPVKGIDAGFRLSMKDGSAYYDFTSEGLSEMLFAFLNTDLKNSISE